METRGKRNLLCLTAISLFLSGAAAHSDLSDTRNATKAMFGKISVKDSSPVGGVPREHPAKSQGRSPTLSLPSDPVNSKSPSPVIATDPRVQPAIQATIGHHTKSDLRVVARMGPGMSWANTEVQSNDDRTEDPPTHHQPEQTGMMTRQGEMTWRDLNSPNLESNSGASELPGALWVLGSGLIGLGLLERIRRS
jgi:hypothetical protein